MFGKIPQLKETFKRDKIVFEGENALEEIVKEAQEHIYRVIRKGDRMTSESAKNLLPITLFNARRYTLTETGRFTLNRKLNVIDRILNTYLADNIYSYDGSLLYEKGTFITLDIAKQIHEDYKNRLIPM
ncbi:DNA-directed RNA polymerase subunit beta [Chlamydia abortus]|jgi:DNA-directed RNA polymerase (fragment)|nr:DNA-directed RNA polymerase subunit beta [Chlamydia abortus]SGA32147.1 DNA-directed RNA polymerase subunit beta [Chlamydia abortus]